MSNEAALGSKRQRPAKAAATSRISATAKFSQKRVHPEIVLHSSIISKEATSGSLASRPASKNAAFVKNPSICARFLAKFCIPQTGVKKNFKCPRKKLITNDGIFFHPFQKHIEKSSPMTACPTTNSTMPTTGSKRPSTPSTLFYR